MFDDSEFRRWCHNLWLDNCAELESYRLLPYTMQEYFQKHKYWLKREFQHRKKSKIDKPDLAIGFVLDDKFDSTGVRLISDNQNRLLKTLKDNNEKQR